MHTYRDCKSDETDLMSLTVVRSQWKKQWQGRPKNEMLMRDTLFNPCCKVMSHKCSRQSTHQHDKPQNSASYGTLRPKKVQAQVQSMP